MNFDILRKTITELASKACELVTKNTVDSEGNTVANPMYRDGETLYQRNGAVITDTKGTSFISASNGKYYQLPKSKKSERTAQQNLERMAINLENFENRYGKHVAQIFYHMNKLIELTNSSDKPLDPTWNQKFWEDLMEAGTAYKRVADRNIKRFEDWSAEPTSAGASTQPTSKIVAWTPY
jgi:hypothetical protein